MNIYKIIKIIIIAAGIFVSAVFYTKNNRDVFSEQETEYGLDKNEGEESVKTTGTDLYADTVTDSGLDQGSVLEVSSGETKPSPQDFSETNHETDIKNDSLESSKEDTTQTSLYEGKININTATKEELMTLKGIGETRAKAIIDYRENYGNFQYIEEIMNVKGIKEGAFSKIKDSIYV